ncbi:MAG: sigma-70 family RNA polymerase sigma factor [Myxococcota bacterium]
MVRIETRVTVLPTDAPEVMDRFHVGLPLVEVIARQMSNWLGALAEYDDLVSAGREGLLDAARRFDPDLEVPFEAFAKFRIRGAMLDDVRRLATLPRRAHERVVALEAATRASEGASDFSPPRGALDEGAWEDSFTDHLETVATAAAIALRVHGQDAPHSAEGDPEQALERAELLACLREGLQTLPTDEATLVRRYFLNGDRLDDIGRDLRIKKSWACRIQARALARLNRYMRRVT